MGVRDGLVRLAGGAAIEERSFPPNWLAAQMADALRFDGHTYLASSQTWGSDERPVEFGESSAYTSNGIAFSVVRRRVDLFKQARFAF